MATADSSVSGCAPKRTKLHEEPRRTLNVAKEVASLQRMTVDELRQRYLDLFHEPTKARNRVWLVRRIIWRMQSLEEGGLSERARRRAMELAKDSDLRTTAPRERQFSKQSHERTQTIPVRFNSGSRIPLPGTVLTRHYKGRLIQVKVLPKGFEFEGTIYKSLSAVAKAVTGSHWNGFKFFNLQSAGDSQ